MDELDLLDWMVSIHAPVKGATDANPYAYPDSWFQSTRP